MTIGKRAYLWMLAGAMLLALAYLAMSAAAYWYVKYRRGYATVAYADIVLPSRWPEFRRKRGAAYIQRGLALLDQGNARDGLYQLRVGLARDPANLQGRLALVQLYGAAGRPDLAQQTLLSGLSFHDSEPEYVTTVLEFLLERAQTEQAVEVCEQIQRKHPNQPKLAELAAFYAARARYAQGRYDQAADLLRQHQLDHRPDGRLLLARINWDQGYQQLALMQLRSLAEDYPANAAIFAQLEEGLRATHHYEEAGSRALARQLAYPDQPQAYISQIYCAAGQADAAAVQRLADQFMVRFANHPQGLLALGDFAASQGLPRIARQILALSQPRDADRGMADTARLMLIEALCTAGQYDEAATELHSFQRNPHLDAGTLSITHGLAAIIQYGQGNDSAGRASIEQLLADPESQPAGLQAIARRLLAMGAAAPARRVLAGALQRDPQNQRLLQQLAGLELGARNVADMLPHLRQLLALPHPPRPMLGSARQLLQGDAWLFLPDRGTLLADLNRVLGSPAHGLR